MISTGFHGLYILLEITCYNYRKYIYFSASKLFNQCKMTPPAPVVYDIPSIFAGDTVSYSSNKKSGVNIQQGQYSTCRVYQKLEKNVFAKLLKNDPGYIFNDSRSQFSTEKKYPMFNKRTRFKILRYTGEGLQNFGLCSALRAFEQGGIFIVPHLL